MFHALYDNMTRTDQRMESFVKSKTFVGITGADEMILNEFGGKMKRSWSEVHHNCVHWPNKNPEVTLPKQVNRPGVTAVHDLSEVIINSVFFYSILIKDIHLQAFQTEF